MMYAMLLGGYCVVVTTISCLAYNEKKATDETPSTN
jgi:hypothetical protein